MNRCVSCVSGVLRERRSDVGQELLRARMLRAVEEVVGRGALQHLALVHEQHAVGHLARKAHLVRDAHHGHAVAREVAHHQQHLADHLGVERAGGLVEQHQRRLHRERARDGHALLLAAGEFARPRVGLVRQAHALQQRHRALVGLLAREAAQLHGRHRAVLQHREVREQVELLEHEADARAEGVHVQPRRVDVLAVDHDAARLDRLQPVEGADQRRLARARRPAHHDDLALVDGLGHVDQGVVAAVPLVDFVEFDHAVTLAVAVEMPRRASRRSSQ
jgi:hypothetical protein